MFDRIPLRGTGRIVRDVNLEACLIGPTLQLALPKSTTRAVSTAGIRLNEDRGGLGVSLFAFSSPPVTQRINTEMPCLGGSANTDMAFVASRVVDAVRYRPALGVLPKVVGVHLLRRARPLASRILEITNQLFLLCIDADRGAVSFLEPTSLAADVVELPVSVRMRRTGEPLHVDPRRKSQQSKQPPNGRAACFAQTLGQVTQTAANEFFPARRLATRFVLDQLLQLVAHTRVFFSMRTRPPPGKRTRSSGRPARWLSNS